jgi:hypothetical protein
VISHLAHDVFTSAYIDAMKATLVLPVIFLAFTALTTVLIKRRQRTAEQPAVAREELKAAAG